MKSQFTLPCRAGEVRGILRHSHLDNRFLTMLPRDADDLRDCYSAEKPDLRQFKGLLDELIECLRDVEDGFCAAGLVDTLTPLKTLPREGRAKLKAAIVGVYQKEFRPVERAEDLHQAADDVITKLERLLAAKKPKVADGAALREAALMLYNILDQLPRGVWLWPQKEDA